MKSKDYCETNDIEKALATALITHWSPGGNDTYLVISPDLERQQYPEAEKLIRAQVPVLEQGGFLTKSQNPETVLRLNMAGGEFCGNAARCVGAFVATDFIGPWNYANLANYNVIKQDKNVLTFSLEVSGLPGILPVRCVLGDSKWDVGIDVSLVGTSIDQYKFAIDQLKVPAVLVTLPGISHVLVAEDSFPFISEHKWQLRLFEQLREQMQRIPDALGLIWYKRLASGFSIKPLVWVIKTNSCTLETACGSGSLAIALAFARSTSTSIPVTQPSGKELSIRLGVGSAMLSGPVERRPNIEVFKVRKMPSEL